MAGKGHKAPATIFEESASKKVSGTFADPYA